MTVALTMLLTPARVAAAARALELRVMTYNIDHGAGEPCTPKSPVGAPLPDCSAAKLQLAAQVIREQAADIVGLQEVDRFWGRSGYVDQAGLLALELGMSLCYGANLQQGPDTHSIVRHEYGTAILSRLPIKRCTNTPLPKAVSSTEQRGLNEAIIRVAGRDVRFFTTHLQNCTPGIADQCGPGNPDRTIQVRTILRDAGTTPDTILAGDLNAEPAWPELSPLGGRFVDAWRAAGKGLGYTYTAHPSHPAVKRIDYVLVRGLDVRGAEVPVSTQTRLASDHYPVVSVVRLKSTGGRAPVYRAGDARGIVRTMRRRNDS